MMLVNVSSTLTTSESSLRRAFPRKVAPRELAAAGRELSEGAGTLSPLTCQSQHVPHIVHSRRAGQDPVSGTEGAPGKGLSTGSLVTQFKAFSRPGKKNGVFPDDVAAPNCVDPDLS